MPTGTHGSSSLNRFSSEKKWWDSEVGVRALPFRNLVEKRWLFSKGELLNDSENAVGPAVA